MLRQKKAQSTLEYIIIFTVIVGAIILAANAFIRSRVETMLNHTSEQAVNAVQHINFTQ
ncbi:MAG: hypothetical protein WC628_00805 [Candidatus Omnitrophota bacterium]